MRSLLILILSLFFTISALGQTLPDSGFTNKAEAKNQLVNELREGKWVDYVMRDSTLSKDTLFYVLSIYKAGKINGIVRWYYYSNGVLEVQQSYLNGKKNGIEKDYYSNGKLYRELPYSNGKINGLLKTYYESGKVNLETPFSEGKANGVEKEYYESGKVEAEIIWVNDILGDIKKYDENGDVLKYGLPIGTKQTDENGKEIKK